MPVATGTLEAGERLADHHRCQEKPLDECTREAEGRPNGSPEPGGVVVRCDTIDQVGATCDVSTPRREAAAEVLDQRSHDEIGAERRGLVLFDQLAVAVIDQDCRAGRDGFHRARDRTAFARSQRAARRVSARALHENGGAAGRTRGGDRLGIGSAGGIERHFRDFDSARGERVRGVDQRAAQRVVRPPRRDDEALARRDACGDGGDDRVRPADQREPGERALRAEDPREQRLVCIARRVVVSVTEGSPQVGVGQTLGLERGEHRRAHA